MNFTLPTASRKRLDELLTYLAQPCENYPGNRAEDFKAAVDVESEWAWMYAALVLRGMKQRKLPYAERHHMVPFSWYKMNGFKGTRNSPYVCENNMSVLTYAEHTYAHFCLALMSAHIIKGKLATAFCRMFSYKSRYLPGNEEVLNVISADDYDKVRLLQPHVAKVEAEGRTHGWVDINKARQEYRDLHKVERAERELKRYYDKKDIILEQKKVYYSSHREERSIANKEWRELNKDVLKEKRQTFRKEHPDIVKERDRIKYYKHRDTILVHHKQYYAEHKEECNEKSRKYYAEHRDECKEYNKVYHSEHRDELNAQSRKWHHEHRDYANMRRKAYALAHKEEDAAKRKAKYDAKVNEGYRIRTDPVTGKRGWVFVGRPETKFNEQTLSATGT